MSYGSAQSQRGRSAGYIADQLLRGANPSDIPLAINLKTFNAMGITVRATLMARADKVIE
jgi:ABC-type uncharacterized transport system substrate-binding protein